MTTEQKTTVELLNPQTFRAPTLPSHWRLAAARQPVFVFRVRPWRKSVERDEIVVRLRKCETDGQCALLIYPLIKEFLVVERSADIERLTYRELVELWAVMGEGERAAVKLNIKRPPSWISRFFSRLYRVLFSELHLFRGEAN